MKKALLIHCNPDERCVVAETQLIKKYSKNYIIDSVNLNEITSHIHPDAGIRDYIYELIDAKYKRFILKSINGIDITKKIKIKKFKDLQLPLTINEIRNFKKNNVSIGLAALSTAASYSKCNSVFCSDYGRYLIESFKIANQSYHAGRILLKENYKFIIIFNGRFAISRPISEVLRLQSGADILYYEFDDPRMQIMESLNSTFTFEVFGRNILHSKINFENSHQFFSRKINKKWNEIENKIRKNQINGNLPEILIEKKFAVFFTSSPDEYFAVYDNEKLSDDFINQYAFAYQLALECKKNNMLFVIRLHPNLRFKHESWKREWNFKELTNLNVLIIYPDSEFDSYEILINSSVVFTAGSTIAVESAYAKKPTANVGKSVATYIGCAVEIRTLCELRNFIKNPFIEKNAYDSALLFGSYFVNQNDQKLDLNISNGVVYLYEKVMSPSKFIVNKLKKIIFNIVSLSSNLKIKN